MFAIQQNTANEQLFILFLINAPSKCTAETFLKVLSPLLLAHMLKITTGAMGKPQERFCAHKLPLCSSVRFSLRGVRRGR